MFRYMGHLTVAYVFMKRTTSYNTRSNAKRRKTGSATTWRNFAGKLIRNHGRSLVNTATGAINRYRASKSKTRTKSKTFRTEAEELHSGVNYFTKKLKVNKPFKGITKGTPNLRVHDVYSGYYTVAEGQTSNLSVTTVGTVNQAMVTGNSAGVATSSYSALEMNPYQKTSGSTTFAAGLVPAADRILLKTCQLEIRVKNMSTLQAYVEIFVVKNKLDMTDSVITAWDKMLKNEWLDKLVEINQTKGGEHPSSLGQHVELCKDFRKAFKVLHKHKIRLSGGSEELAKYDVAMNLLYSAERIIALQPGFTSDSATWTNGNTTIPYLKNGIQVFLKMEGGVIWDETTTASVSTGGPKVAFVCSRTCNYKVVNANARLPLQLGQNMLQQGHNTTVQQIINLADTAADIINL